MDVAAATAASMAHKDEVAASSTNPDAAVHPGTVPVNVEFPKEVVVQNRRRSIFENVSSLTLLEAWRSERRT